VVVVVAVGVTAQSDLQCAGLNSCSAHGQCRNGVCVCHSGFGGADCSKRTDNCPNHCHGHGKCLNGLCDCYLGFAGRTCNLVAEACPDNCTGHGMCHNGQCVCLPSFWTGAACDVEIYNCPDSLNNCSGRGECGPSDWENDNSPWVCSCEAGFCGASCDEVCSRCPQNCSGHGICKGGVCDCNSGFAGPACDNVAAVSTCPNNCSGQGTCRMGNNSVLRCHCEDCYSGSDCSKSTVFCPGNCSSHGTCGCDGKCYCRPGYTGLACQSILPTCATLGFCSGNGNCVNGTCKCTPGFAGKSCDLACHTGGDGDVGCHAPKHGRCMTNNNGNATCVCKPEFEGIGCQDEATDGFLDSYLAGWNPIGTVVLAMTTIVVSLFLGSFLYNYYKGQRGMNAVPGIGNMRSTVKGTDYDESLIARNQANY